MTTVVNIKHEAYDVYIGRGSKWGNPFRIGRDGGRKAVVAKYMGQPDLLACLHELKDKVLGCHCVPKACHGQPLAAFVDVLIP